MIGYPITYGDTLEEVNSFTSEMFITEISEYWSNEKNKINFNKGYKLGLLVFGIGGLVLISRPAFASDSGVLPNNNGAGGGGSCPETGPTQSGTPAPGPGNALGICGIAMKSGAYWIGFVCAAAVIVGVHIVGVRMAAIPPDQAL